MFNPNNFSINRALRDAKCKIIRYEEASIQATNLSDQ
jgi:hypothetical protein